jgi:hypothetical protein
MPARRWLCALLLAGLVAACNPPSERPIRGAVPRTETPATPPGVPPTLVASEALRPSAAPSPATPASPEPGASPSPLVAPSPNAEPSPSVVAAPPIVRTIAPANGGAVPTGAPVTVSAVLVGRGANLASASLALDGADTGATIDRRAAQDWTIHTTQPLAAGTHTARVLVRDDAGNNGGFTWQFTVGSPPPEPGDEPTPRPTAVPAKPAASPAPRP